MSSPPIGEDCAEIGPPYLGIAADPRHFDTACRRLEAVAERGAAA